jgi:Ca2+-binding EF-hand superfamily protein
MVNAFDEDGDGEISYNELLDQLKRVINGEEIHKKPSGAGSHSKKWQVTDKTRGEVPIAAKHQSIDAQFAGQYASLGGGAATGRFSAAPGEIPSLGHGHLHICKSIDAKYAVVNDALKRLDYDKRYFISVHELKAAVETYCGRLNPVLWSDLVRFFDPSDSGVVDYESFLAQVRDQANYDQYATNSPAYGGLRSGFGLTGGGAKVVSHVAMQNGGTVANRGTAIGMGAHGSNDVHASMKFLCEKIYEKFSNIRTAFMSLDQDRGGTIGKRELKNILDDCCYIVPDETFEECYKLFDENGDGDISYNEFMNQVKSIVEPGEGGSPLDAYKNSNDPQSLSNQLISHQDVSLGKHSFAESQQKTIQHGQTVVGGHDSGSGLKFLQEKLRTQTESVRTAFRILDHDQTGAIGADELRRVLDNYCYVMSDPEFGKLMDVLDADHDGNISYEEFMDKIGSEITYQAPRRQTALNSKLANNPVNNSGSNSVLMGGPPQATGMAGRAKRVAAPSQITFG